MESWDLSDNSLKWIPVVCGHNSNSIFGTDPIPNEGLCCAFGLCVESMLETDFIIQRVGSSLSRSRAGQSEEDLTPPLAPLSANRGGIIVSWIYYWTLL